MDTPFRPLAPGYRVPPALRALVQDCHKTSYVRTLGYALCDLAAIVLLAALGSWCFKQLPLPFSIVAALGIWVGIARFLRALECLVHEGSHYNWSRHKLLNDLSCNILVALPVFSTVAKYRPSHVLHHSALGSHDDSDFERYQRLKIEHLRRHNIYVFLADIIPRLPSYVAGWFVNIGASFSTLASSMAWHGMVILLLTALLGFSSTIRLWLIFFAIPFGIVLPVVRFIGEASKHRYNGATSVCDATVTNYAFVDRWLIHPHADYLHTLHHLFPHVPHHALVRLDHTLNQDDPDGYRRHLRTREHLLENPTTAAERLS